MTATTIVRFITVRNPRKPTKSELETGFVFYDLGNAAALITAVANAGTPGAKREAIATFIKGGDYLATPAALDELAAGLVC